MPTAWTSYTPPQPQVAGVLAFISALCLLVQALWEGEPLKISSVAVDGDE